MHGTIRGTHLLTHGPLILRLFGVKAYFRCVVCALRTPGKVTFLSALGDSMLN